MAKLTMFVHVPLPRGGHEIFGPDDEVPAWAVPLITNPLAWEGDAPVAQVDLRSTDTEPVKAPTKRAATRRRAVEDGAVRSG